jgi:UDP:flavonoid glycosyltransferase YjiC (YdhE family)
MENLPNEFADKKIFVILLPEHGAFNASFMLARRLKERGYTPVYVGPSRFEKRISDQGFDFNILEAAPLSGEGIDQAKSARNWRQKLRQFRMECEQDSSVLDDIERLIDTKKPRLALLDPIMWTSSPPFLKKGVQILGLNTTLAATFEADIAPVFSGIMPEPNRKYCMYLRNILAWAKVMANNYVRTVIWDVWLLAAFGPFKYRKCRSRSLVRKYGGRLRWGEYGSRLVVPELVMAPRELDFPRVSTRTKRIYIGTCVDPQRRELPFDWGSIKKGRPLIYCSLGTYSHYYPHSKKLFSAVVEALRPNMAWQAIIQVGDVAEPKDFGSLPKHLLVVKNAPQLDILAHASIFITHGGPSSVRESIYFGTPMIVFPCWLDQQGNAARIVYHRLGVKADISKVHEGQIRDLLERVQDKKIRKALQRMQTIFREQERCELGAEAIDQYLRDSRI